MSAHLNLYPGAQVCNLPFINLEMKIEKQIPFRLLHTSPVMSKIVAGKYKVTLDKSKPLTYEMAVQPDHIGIHKSFNSFNTGQLEDTLGYKKWTEKGGTVLSYKLFMEDLFIRK